MRKKLSETQLAAALAGLPGWTGGADRISRTFEFPTYKDGLVFAVAIGQLADAMDHHPDLTIGYRRVEVALSTHDAGGVSEFDVRLAGKIEALR